MRAEISIKAKAGAKADKLGGWQTDAEGKLFLKISVKQIPEHGKANEDILRLLSKALGLPLSAFEIIRGHTSSHKTIGISDITLNDVLGLIHLPRA